MASQHSLKNEHKPEKSDTHTLLERCGFTAGARKKVLCSWTWMGHSNFNFAFSYFQMKHKMWRLPLEASSIKTPWLLYRGKELYDDEEALPKLN